MRNMTCPSCGYGNIEGMDRCENCMKPLRDLDIPRAEAATGVVRSVMEDLLGGLPPRDVPTVAPSDTAADAARLMREAGAGVALVIDAGELKGVFTEGDAVRALIENPGGATQVADVMTRDVMPVPEAHSVAHALSEMATGATRFVPVERADGRYAVVTCAAVLEYLADKDW